MIEFYSHLHYKICYRKFFSINGIKSITHGSMNIASCYNGRLPGTIVNLSPGDNDLEYSILSFKNIIPNNCLSFYLNRIFILLIFSFKSLKLDTEVSLLL